MGDIENTANAGEQNDQSANEFKAPASQEELDRIIQGRLDRERGKFADYDDLKVKAGKADAFQSRITELETTNGELTEKVGSFESEKTRTALLADVSTSTGVPAELLRGETKEDLEAHAELLKPLVKTTGPVVPGQEKTPEKITESDERKAVKKLFRNDS